MKDQEKLVLNTLYLDYLGGQYSEEEYIQEKESIMRMIDNGEDIFM